MEGSIEMPHMTLEYTGNIANEINTNDLLKKMNASLISHEGLFSPQGIRSRAIKLTDYLVGDGSSNDGFVHVNLKIAPGRTEEAKKNVFDHLFQVIEDYFEAVLANHHVTISLEFLELDTGGSMYRQK